MKLSDFHIGLIFSTCLGRWECTDVGQRTVTAIHLDDERYPNDPRGTEGPPYGLKEKVLDEAEIARAYRSLEEAIGPRTNTLHRSYPHEVVFAHMKRRIEMRELQEKGGANAYPLRILVGTRIRNGEDYSAHAAHKDEQGQWIIEGFNFHQQCETTMPEAEWFSLPIADKFE
jgi:hypothetical protein